MKPRSRREYSALLQNFRDFDEQENQDRILDIIDMYADLEETL